MPEARWRSSSCSTIRVRIALSSYAAEGNNGGDGFVVALANCIGRRVVEVLLLASRIDLRGDALAMFERLPLRPIEVTGRRS